MGCAPTEGDGVRLPIDTSRLKFLVVAPAEPLRQYEEGKPREAWAPRTDASGEVLLDGDHSIDRCHEVTRAVHRALFDEMHAHRVDLRGALMKTSMVLSGKDAKKRAGVEEVAERTVACLYETTPPALAGVVFLSGGQTEEEATAHLNAMVRLGPHPWELSFSYARALQGPAIKAWAGKPENVAAAQKALYHRAKLNSAARSGTYEPSMEKQAA
jgi:fructose-bisphosphate aldolase, class I